MKKIVIILIVLICFGCGDQTVTDLSEVSMYVDRIKVYIPDDLVKLPEERILDFYKDNGETPQYVYTNSAETVFLSFAITNLESSDEMVELMQNFLYNRWQKLDVIKEVTTEGIIDINDKEYGIIRYLNVEDDPYRMMVTHSELDGYMFAIKFKYPESDNEWSEVEDFIYTIEVLY